MLKVGGNCRFWQSLRGRSISPAFLTVIPEFAEGEYPGSILNRDGSCRRSFCASPRATRVRCSNYRRHPSLSCLWRTGDEIKTHQPRPGLLTDSTMKPLKSCSLIKFSIQTGFCGRSSSLYRARGRPEEPSMARNGLSHERRVLA